MGRVLCAMVLFLYPLQSVFMDLRLWIARPSGWQLEATGTGTWLADLCYYLGQTQPFKEVAFGTTMMSRIAMARNIEVRDAKKWGATHLLFLDPDMIPDAYCGRDPNAVPWWPTYFSFLQAHPGSVLGTPACGAPPDERVQVWGKTPAGETTRIPRDAAATARGWQRVAMVGSALLLIDMTVFDKLPQPYFSDVYTDETQTELAYSQDCYFCRQCEKHGVNVFVNFDCWADHQHFTRVRRPNAPVWEAERRLQPSSPGATEESILGQAETRPGDAAD